MDFSSLSGFYDTYSFMYVQVFFPLHHVYLFVILFFIYFLFLHSIVFHIVLKNFSLLFLFITFPIVDILLFTLFIYVDLQ